MDQYILLHRDGVVNVRQDAPISSPDQFVFLPFALEAFFEMERQGFKPVVLVNEEGLNDKSLSPEDHKAIVENMKTSIVEEGGLVHDVMVCPSALAPWEKCAFPKPGLLQIAAAKHKFDLSQTWFISDRWDCLEAGWAAGCKNALVRSGKPFKTIEKLRNSQRQPEFIERDILGAVLRILRLSKVEA
ncbi:MAG: HAD hydrolase-like protein [bacterium]|nr:HAD hydrolase-like protein [bacterium]